MATDGNDDDSAVDESAPTAVATREGDVFLIAALPSALLKALPPTPPLPALVEAGSGQSTLLWSSSSLGVVPRTPPSGPPVPPTDAAFPVASTSALPPSTGR